ncbi:MAG TPA: hypothetical protein VFN67_35305 [Polyangiales bacterium]|jgi:nitrate/nitrite transporter NarK|nr:hypothetical protein [Polyangiales bacterium]
MHRTIASECTREELLRPGETGRHAERLLLTAATRLKKQHPAAMLTGLGIAQLVAWGTLYYSIAVLGQPIRSELGLTEPELFGVFTWSLMLSGLLARSAGKLVDHMGGRFVLVTSCGFGACGFALLATLTDRRERGSGSRVRCF